MNAINNLQPLDGDGVRLRLLTAADLPHTLTWRNRDEVRCWFKHSDVVSIGDHQAWFNQHQLRSDAIMLIVEDIKTDIPVGQVSIYNIDREISEAEVGRFIAATGASGKGFIRAAILKLVDFAFTELMLRRVFLEVYRDNLRAIRLYESVGFIEIKPDRPTTCGSERPVAFMERVASSSPTVQAPSSSKNALNSAPSRGVDEF